MRNSFIGSLLLAGAGLALVFACSPNDKPAQNRKTESQITQNTTPQNNQANKISDLQYAYDRIAPVDLTNVDTSFLNAEQKQVLNLLIEAAELMNPIYLRQVYRDNPKIRNEIANSDIENKELYLKMFDLHFGPWDSVNEDKPFWGDIARPDGGGFYPPDMSKQEFNDWIKNNPQDKEAFNSWFTIIERTDDGGLRAVPYSKAYKQWLVPAAEKLRQAAEITSNPSLKKYLNLRAKAFLDDNYLESEMAWMDLKGTPIEVVIGPYEVYTDKLFNVKTAFEAFITIKNPAESAALEKYKKYLVDMEKNLPVDEKYKNFKRGFESPIVAAYQIHGGGDNVPGVQTIAFNLPNDERVREAKGAKKVILNNVLGAKFDLILAPMAEQILVKEQADMLVKKYMSYGTLFHELSHSLGPGTIIVDGKKTEVRAQLQELYSPIEEGKADVMGAYNILYMMDLGELPKSEKKAFLATYFTGLFRAMRFGINSAHGGGAAYQYNYLKEQGAFDWDERQKRFVLDFDKLEQGISDLTAEIVILQANGNYNDAKKFLDKYKKTDENIKTVIKASEHLPIDIAPKYPDRI